MKEKYRNSPEFYVEGDRLDICSYQASDPIKRLQIWYRICPTHRLFKIKDKELLLDMLKSFEEALGISEEPGIYNVECSMKEIGLRRPSCLFIIILSIITLWPPQANFFFIRQRIYNFP